jgi:hypothetical protein
MKDLEQRREYAKAKRALDKTDPIRYNKIKEQRNARAKKAASLRKTQMSEDMYGYEKTTFLNFIKNTATMNY